MLVEIGQRCNSDPATSVNFFKSWGKTIRWNLRGWVYLLSGRPLYHYDPGWYNGCPRTCNDRLTPPLFTRAAEPSTIARGSITSGELYRKGIGTCGSPDRPFCLFPPPGLRCVWQEPPSLAVGRIANPSWNCGRISNPSYVISTASFEFERPRALASARRKPGFAV
jgi:hypothetical protein